MIDTHVHLSHRQFDRDRENVLQRAHEAGMELIVEVGFDLPSSRRAVSLCKTGNSIFGAVGVHPHDSEKATPHVLDEIRTLSLDSAVVAIGETGLDFFKNFSPRESQENLFRWHIRLSLEMKKPLVIHNRASMKRVLEIVRDEAGGGEIRGVLHCFSGDEAALAGGVELGFYIGVGGSITYSDEKAHTLARKIPVERLVVETDAPYLSPVPFRGKRNEPANLRFVLEKLASILNIPAEEVERRTSENAKALFLGD